MRIGGLLVGVGVPVLVALASLAVRAKAIPPPTVWHELLHYDGSADGVVIRSLRVPRTLLGLAVGAALGLAGALMQALTRNPLADPGILGVNAGAAAASVAAIGLLGVTDPAGYLWFALAGAAIAAVLVSALGRSSPTRLVLLGTAVSAALGAFVAGMTLVSQNAFDAYRFWAVGTLAGRPLSVLAAVGPVLLAGAVLAIALARPLNALALGEDTGHALGAQPGHAGARRGGRDVVAVTLLCGAATAAVGPIGFVGLAVPYIARGVAGPDQRRVLSYSTVLAPILLLGADTLGRVVARPGELQVGIVTALLGAPVLILLAHRPRVAVT